MNYSCQSHITDSGIQIAVIVSSSKINDYSLWATPQFNFITLHQIWDRENHSFNPENRILCINLQEHS